MLFRSDGPAARMECANFSGQWKMKCTTTSSQGNATSDLTMGISQKDCLAIKSGDDAAYFGGMASRTDFIPSNEFAEVHSTVGYSYEWVDQKSSFQVKLGGLMKITSNTAPSAPKVTTSTISGKFLYTLAGNQLKVAGTFLTTDYPVFEMNCVGERQ